MKYWYSVILFFFISIQIIAQNILPIIPDFRISADEINGNFVQQNPKLFTNSNKEFLIAWEDYRNGGLTYFAQRFDSLGNKIQNNVEVQSTDEFVIAESSNFLNISSISGYNYFGGGFIDFYANAYNQSSETLQNGNYISTVDLPWCGTGYLGWNIKTINFPNSYIFAEMDNGHLTLFKINYNGEITDTSYFSENFEMYYVTNFDITSLHDKLLVTWMNINSWESYSYDSTLKGVILDKDLNSLTDVFIIEEINLDSLNYYYTEHTEILNNFKTSDSTFLISNFNRVTSEFIYRQYDIAGNRVTEDSSITIIDIFSYPIGTWYFQELNTSSLDTDENVFSIIYSSGQTSYKNTLIYFDSHGNFKEIKSESTFKYLGGKGKYFFQSEDIHFRASENNSDVFLSKMHGFDEIENIKINDDTSASNESNPLITIRNKDSYFITWETEQNNYGRIVNQKGEILEEQINLNGTENLWLNNHCINFWEDNYKGDTLIIGFSVYDSLWNTVLSKNIAKVRKYNYDKDFIKLNDSTFIYSYSSDDKIYLKKYDETFSELKTNSLNIYNNKVKLFREDESSFWLSSLFELQLFNEDLNIISEQYENNVSNYLGANQFLSISTEYSDFGNYLFGYIKNSLGDTLSDKITFKFLGENYDYNFKVIPINSKKFLTIYNGESSKNNCSYWKVFTTDGKQEAEGRILHNENVLISTSATATINENQVFFVWSDYRDGNLGYDIYGNIYDLNTLTGLKENEVSKLSGEFKLYQNYPNPFNPTTTINYVIPSFSEKLYKVELKIFDLLGREVKSLVNEHQRSGNYEIIFDGSKLSSGVYFYKLSVDNFSATKKFILLK